MTPNMGLTGRKSENNFPNEASRSETRGIESTTYPIQNDMNEPAMTEKSQQGNQLGLIYQSKRRDIKVRKDGVYHGDKVSQYGM